jgi:hypothetical protein
MTSTSPAKPATSPPQVLQRSLSFKSSVRLRTFGHASVNSFDQSQVEEALPRDQNSESQNKGVSWKRQSADSVNLSASMSMDGQFFPQGQSATADSEADPNVESEVGLKLDVAIAHSQV